MDAVKFIKELHRMCASHPNCYYDKCPMDVEGMDCDFETMASNAKKVASLVEQWSKEHPIKTNRQKYKEVFGGEYKNLPCPPLDCLNTVCAECLKWWDEEYIEPKE